MKKKHCFLCGWVWNKVLVWNPAAMLTTQVHSQKRSINRAVCRWKARNIASLFCPAIKNQKNRLKGLREPYQKNIKRPIRPSLEQYKRYICNIKNVFKCFKSVKCLGFEWLSNTWKIFFGRRNWQNNGIKARNTR